jgi:hypothetical protein
MLLARGGAPFPSEEEKDVEPRSVEIVAGYHGFVERLSRPIQMTEAGGGRRVA